MSFPLEYPRAWVGRRDDDTRVPVEGKLAGGTPTFFPSSGLATCLRIVQWLDAAPTLDSGRRVDGRRRSRQRNRRVLLPNRPLAIPFSTLEACALPLAPSIFFDGRPPGRRCWRPRRRKRRCCWPPRPRTRRTRPTGGGVRWVVVRLKKIDGASGSAQASRVEKGIGKGRLGRSTRRLRWRRIGPSSSHWTIPKQIQRNMARREKGQKGGV